MRRILVAVLSAFMIVALSAVPGAANEQVPPHVAAGAFAGTATLTTGTGQDPEGLYYPVSPDCGASLCDGRTKTWSFSGDGAGIHYQPPGGGPFAGAGPLETAVGGGAVSSGIGGLGAYCGYSSGNGGSGDLYLDEAVRAVTPFPGGLNVSTQYVHVTAVGWHQSAATLIPFYGHVDQASTNPYGDRTPATTPAHGKIVGVVSAIPTPGAGSCTTGDATDFTIVGAAVAIWHDGAA